jgi:hypothetical protein
MNNWETHDWFSVLRHSVVKMEAIWPFKTLVSYVTTRWCYNSEDHNLNLHCRENLKSRHMTGTYHHVTADGNRISDYRLFEMWLC